MNELFKQKEKPKSIIEDKRGLTSVEYVIILALIAIACITAWNNFGDALTGAVDEYRGAVEGLDDGL